MINNDPSVVYDCVNLWSINHWAPVSDHCSHFGLFQLDLRLPGFIRFTGTREYRWLMLWSWHWQIVLTTNR